MAVREQTFEADFDQRQQTGDALEGKSEPEAALATNRLEHSLPTHSDDAISWERLLSDLQASGQGIWHYAEFRPKTTIGLGFRAMVRGCP